MAVLIYFLAGLRAPPVDAIGLSLLIRNSRHEDAKQKVIVEIQ